MATQVSSLPVSYDPYLRQGWRLTPIQAGTKGPKGRAWNRKENTITDPGMIPPGVGIGLCHAYSGTMALDIDEWERASRELIEHGIDLQALYDAPDAVTINSGNPGHGKLLYAMPFGMALTSKKLIDTLPDGTKYNYLDFRCATSSGLTVQDVLPPTIHPVTCKPYQWGGRGNWQRLPVIPTSLLEFWQSLLSQDTERTIGISGATINTSWDEIKQALDYIDPNINRDEWVKVGMALHYAGAMTDQLDQALMIWDEWSAQSPSKYKGQRDIINVWRSFSADDDGVKLGTLFQYASKAGWKRPPVDVAHLFTQVTVTSPKSIIEDLIIKPPICPVDCFPETLVSRARVIQQEFAADPLVAIFAGLAAACAAADKRIRLRLMAEWLVPPVLWTMTIGSPSAKKTPATDPMLAVLRDIEKADLPRYRNELQIFEALDAAYASSKKAYLAAAQDASNLLGGNLDTGNLPMVANQPAKPAQLRLTVSDITSQKILRMAADRPRGLVCILDEARSWAEKITNIHSGESRSTWVEGYNCRSTTMDRVGDGKTDGHTNVDHFALGIHCNIQPQVLKDKLPSLTSDGLIQRFIFAVIDDKYSDILNNPDAKDAISQLQYDQCIKDIFNLPVQEYKLSAGAYDSFRQFQEYYLLLKKDERLANSTGAYMEALGKIEGTTGRLILVFHLLTEPFNLEVSTDTANRAIQIVIEYIIPVLRYVYGDIEGIDKGGLDQWILDHVLWVSGHSSTITLSEIKRSAKRRIEGMTVQKADMMICDAMAVLEANGWATIVESTHKTLKWALNPIIKDADEDYRKSVVEAKQRIYAEITRASGGKVPMRIIRK